jgi:class 3 adenylate cyclase
MAGQLDSLHKKLNAERHRADQLLFNVFPEGVALQLKQGKRVAPRTVAGASVLFCDFVRFTSYAATIPPELLVEQLAYVFGRFEKICQAHGLEKLKTIGDAFMCVAGLTDECADHAARACRAALEMQAFMEMERESGAGKTLPLQLRAGIHSGTVVSGITGREKLAFDIWGHTVNIAARMESTAVPDKIQVSAATRTLAGSDFKFVRRGLIELKHLQSIETFFLEPNAFELSGKSREKESALTAIATQIRKLFS